MWRALSASHIFAAVVVMGALDHDHIICIVGAVLLAACIVTDTLTTCTAWITAAIMAAKSEVTINNFRED